MFNLLESQKILEEKALYKHCEFHHLEKKEVDLPLVSYQFSIECVLNFREIALRLMPWL